MRIAWTGHRPELFAEPVAVEGHVDAEVARLQRLDPELTIVCGGQRGVDLWVAEVALRFRAPLEVILPTPIRVFTGAWSVTDRARLARVAERGSTWTSSTRGELLVRWPTTYATSGWCTAPTC